MSYNGYPDRQLTADGRLRLITLHFSNFSILKTLSVIPATGVCGWIRISVVSWTQWPL